MSQDRRRAGGWATSVPSGDLVRQTLADAEAHRRWHLYQLADLDLGRGRHTVVDQCRDCGDLAFPPIQTARPHGRKEWWRPSHRDKRSAAPDRESPRQPKQTGAFTLVLARTGETGSAARKYTAGADTDESVCE